MSSHKFSTSFAALFIGAAVLFAACGRHETAPPVIANIPGAPGSGTAVDGIGRVVKLPAKIDRIVSLAPSLTEAVFAVGAGDRLVGVTTYCNYPDEATRIAKVGDTMTPNMETVIALKPDLVLVSTASQIEPFLKTLESNDIAVYVTDPASVGDVLEDLGRLAALFGTEETADRVVAQLEERLSAVDLRTRKQEPVRVFVQISKEPLFTIGRTAFLTTSLRSAGAVSVTADVETAFPKLSKETAAVLEPEAIILSDSPDNQEPNDAFRSSPAVKQKRVFRVNADIIARPGPRLVDAVEQIARDLHPDEPTS